MQFLETKARFQNVKQVEGNGSTVKHRLLHIPNNIPNKSLDNLKTVNILGQKCTEGYIKGFSNSL